MLLWVKPGEASEEVRKGKKEPWEDLEDRASQRSAGALVWKGEQVWWVEGHREGPGAKSK